MRNVLRIALPVLYAFIAGGLFGQTVSFDTRDPTSSISTQELLENSVRVAGQGFEVPGTRISDDENAVHWIGDDPVFALRTYVDTGWASISSSLDSVKPGATVHWVRFHVLAAKDLRRMPLKLNLQVRGSFTLFVNGRQVLRSSAMPLPVRGMLPATDTVPVIAFPVEFAGDGREEVLALRIETAPSAPLASAALRASLHAENSTYRLNRTLLHYGVFIGINVIIFLMALVIGSSERKGRAWMLLAGLSLVSVLDTVCVLGGTMGTLGFPSEASHVLRMARIITLPWGMYLLILVLLVLRDELTHLRQLRYAIGVAVITLIGIIVIIADHLSVLDTSNGFTMVNPSMLMLITAISFLLAYIGILIWFAIEEFRLGIRLWRSKGYERWVGVGAVAGSLLTVALAIAGNYTGLEFSSWLHLLANYCSHIAVPVSVAIYLAIRSAHHTRLVTRQRDELDQEVQDRTAELRTEKERSDALLLNILPHEVAEELKNTGAAAAKHFAQATVLFSDFRGFTQLSEKLTPEQLVREIDTCFKHFDGLMDKWHMEKIKTIGDAYMAAGGLPDPGKGGPADVVRAALDMQDFLREHSEHRSAQGLPVFRMRVGIHTGPVVAGIVGVKKFQYDIWGDTVNTASRMESAGEVGRVNISASLYELVKDEPGFTFTSRGRVQAKGKGEMEMWFVSQAVPSMQAATPDS